MANARRRRKSGRPAKGPKGLNGFVSTETDRVCVSLLPATSVARTVKVWTPSARSSVTLVAMPTVWNAPPSTWISYPAMPDPASDPAQCTGNDDVTTGEGSSRLTTGGAVSTLTLTYSCRSGVLLEASKAWYDRECSPTGGVTAAVSS